MKRLIAWLGLTALCLLIVGAIYIGALNYRGYCFAQNKYLKEDEKIRIALQDVLKNFPIDLYWKRSPDGTVRGGSKPLNSFSRKISDALAG
jgi:hypothetical protein